MSITNKEVNLIDEFLLEHDPSHVATNLKTEAEEAKVELDEKKDSSLISLLGNNEMDEIAKLFSTEEDEEDESEEDEKVEDLSNDKKETKKTPKSKETVEEDEDESEGSDTEYSFKPFIDFLSDKGIVHFDEDSEFTDDEEGLGKVIQDTISIEIENYIESLPPVVQELTSFIEKGGDPAKFLSSLSGPIDLGKIDITSESDQELVIKEYLKSQGYENDEIKETIDDYKDGLILEKQSKIAMKKLEKIQDKRKDEIIAEQEQILANKQKAYDDYIDSVNKEIKSANEIAGLEIKEKEKNDFMNWLLKPGKDGLTGYQKALQENPVKTQIELAFLKYKKYDFSKVASKAKSEAASDLKKSIMKLSDKKPKGQSRQASSDSFAAFRGWNNK